MTPNIIATSVQPVLTYLYCLCSNDAYDAATGVDKTKKESIVNLTGGNPSPVLAMAMACLVAGAFSLWCGIAAAVRRPGTAHDCYDGWHAVITTELAMEWRRDTFETLRTASMAWILAALILCHNAGRSQGQLGARCSNLHGLPVPGTTLQVSWFGFQTSMSTVA